MNTDMVIGIFIGTVIGGAFVCALLGGAFALLATLWQHGRRRAGR